MKRVIRVALPAALVMAAVGCTTQTPTPSPGLSNSPLPSATAGPTETPTVVPSPTVGPTGETGFPSSILGLDVHSVAGIYQLAADGRLDGRLAAVGGYWAQFALPCPFMPHQPVILGFCSGGSFADTPEAARDQGGSANDHAVPLAVPESANGDMLWRLGSSGEMGLGGVGAVVLIVHAADSRAWQCALNDRASCHARLIIDRVAWANGAPLALAPRNSDAGVVPAMTLDQVAAAAVGPGEQIVTAYPLLTTDLNEVDPRFLGQGQGIVWYARVISGTPDPDGTATGKAVLIADATGSVVTALPLTVDAGYQPARVVLDQKDADIGNRPRPRFTVGDSGSVLVVGWLDSSSTPLALEPGEYTVHAFIGLATGPGDPITGPICDLPLTVAAGDDVAYYAQFRPAPLRCAWKVGEWPFN